MKNNTFLDKLTLQILPILKKYHISKAGLFGSVLRRDFSPQSDIDLLIELDDKNITEYFNIKLDLEEKLQRQVDVIQYERIHHLIKNQVLSEQVLL